MKTASFIMWSLTFGLLCFGGGYYFATMQHPKPKLDVAQPDAAIDIAAKEPQYPIEDDSNVKASAEGPAPQKGAAELPRPGQAIHMAGETLQSTLQRFFGAARFDSLVSSTNLTHQFVTLIENTAERRPSGVFTLFTPLTYEFQFDSSGDDMTLSPKNYARYTQYIELLGSVDSQILVLVYKYNYKSFQADFDQLGQGGYFNDRVIAALDVVIKGPEVSDPVILKGAHPFKFANPDYESMPAAQKVLLRMGPENARVLKDKLRELRGLLARKHSK